MRNYVAFIIFLSFSIVTSVSAQDYMYDSGLPNTASYNIDSIESFALRGYLDNPSDPSKASVIRFLLRTTL